MRNPMQMLKQADQLLKLPSPLPSLYLTNNIDPVVKANPNPWRINNNKPRDKVVFIMGATGTGKSRLSIDLATRFPAEIINSDKIQAYKGLDITTNKVTKQDQCGIPHHLLSILHSHTTDFTTTDFCLMATHAVQSILKRDKLPIIVGGSNTYIESLVTDPNLLFTSKYDCCFLWVDVSGPVLHDFVSHRVDIMVESGLVQEVKEMFEFDSGNSEYTRGIYRAIGVPELDKYFRSGRVEDLRDGIGEIKENTCVLADRQLEKIHVLREVKGWELNRVDATEVFRNVGDKVATDEGWDKLVKEPSCKIVTKFLRSRAKFETNLCAKVITRSTIPSNQAIMTASSI